MAENSVFDLITRTTNIGHLGLLTRDGYPHVVLVNFVAVGDRIYFHGSTKGEKYEAFKANQKVSFSIDIPLAQIPSYWRNGGHACTGNRFFKSALIRGRSSLVDDLEEKATALQALMEKHQSEGGFKAVTHDDPVYRQCLEGVAIYRIEPDEIDIGVEIGQNYPDDVKTSLIEKLKGRGLPVDIETIAEIEKSRNNLGTESEPE